ncbi:hypothetical protein CPC08DRAFT_706276 [Agrocybe pediades]|nr:hypothetical protein CPC08DRAFT_706276 [Agrocybe pediades]
MSTIRNGRISSKFKYVKVEGIPELGLEPLEREYSDDDYLSVASDSSFASTTAVKERRKISRAEGCFITKESGYALKKAHWVNPVGNDATLKYEVEAFLRDLGLVRPKFSLHAASNMTPLNRDIHYTLDKLGFLAVTCAKETLQSLISLVEKENEEWKNRGGQYIRYFRLDQPPFTDAKYELVPLHARNFLQKGSSFLVYTELDAKTVSRKMYYAAPDGALREGRDNNQPRLPAFTTCQTPRASKDVLNPFLVVLNAEIAFRRFKRRSYPLCDEYTELVDLTIDLVNKIYFKPLIGLEWNHSQLRSAYSIDMESDAETEGTPTVDQVRTGGTVDNDKTRSTGSVSEQSKTGTLVEKAGTSVSQDQPIRDRNSRLGYIVKNPGPGASHDETVEYYQYLMSGCDYVDEDNSDEDEDEDEDWRV